MKTKSSLLFILIAAFFLTSCGAKKTAATLEVSTSALSVSNSTYTGGLVIMGTNGKESFTLPIPSGTGSGNSVTLELSRSTWTFSAIGWEGATKFQGNSKCGSQTVDLNQDEQTVALSIDYAKCATQTAVFGSSSYRVGNSFIPLKIATCGWLYETDGTTQVSGSTLENYCNSASGTDAKYKNWASSMKIEIPQMIDGVVSQGLSQCIATGSDGLFTTSMNIPEKGAPFVITLYSQLNCPNDAAIISKFDFGDGLGNLYANHDSAFNAFSGAARLFLPSFETKRGYSSLNSEKAKPLQCNFMPCMRVPTAIPGTKDRLIRPGSEFVVTESPGPNQTCANLNNLFTSADITPAPMLPDLQSKCETKDGKLILSLDYSTLLTSPSLTLTFTGGAPISLTFAEEASYEAHELAWDILGYPLNPVVNAPVKNSFSAFFDYPKDSGLLTDPRDLMGPDGAGGLLGPGLNCATSTATTFATFRDDGETKSYRIELLNGGSTQTLGVYVDDTTTLPGDFYQKKIRISRKLSDSTYSPEMVIFFNCGYSIGRMESRHVDSDGSIDKRVIEWNTETAISARVRQIELNEEKVNGVLERMRTSYTFAEAPGDTTKMYARRWELEIEKNGANYDYRSSSSQMHVQNSVTGFSLVEASGSTFTAANLSDTNFAAILTTAVATPSNTCVDKMTFGSGTCGSLPVIFSNQIYGTAFTATDLAPANIQTYFTAI